MHSVHVCMDVCVWICVHGFECAHMVGHTCVYRIETCMRGCIYTCSVWVCECVHVSCVALRVWVPMGPCVCHGVYCMGMVCVCAQGVRVHGVNMGYVRVGGVCA